MKTLLEYTFLICVLFLLSGCAQPQPIPVQPVDAQNPVFRVVNSRLALETGTSYLTPDQMEDADTLEQQLSRALGLP